jgi:hypothetical protein
LSDEHWLDRLGKTLVSGSTRRRFLGAVAALAAGPLRGGGSATADGPVCPDEQIVRACARQWPGRSDEAKHNRRSCRLTCRRCKREQTEFCIVEGDPNNPAKVADCCAPGEECCKAGRIGRCCPQHMTCCPGGLCIDTSSSIAACGDCDTVCPNGTACVDGTCRCPNGDVPCGGLCCGDGQACIDGGCACPGDSDGARRGAARAAGGERCGDPQCPVGQTPCGGECVDTRTDPRHCGGCDAFNPNGLKCCDGNLCHYIDGTCCGATCYPQGWTCSA